MPEVIRGEDNVPDRLRRYGDGFAVDQQAPVHHIVHNDVQIFLRTGDVELLHGDGQIQRVQERHDLKQLFPRRIFQHKLSDKAEGDLFPVQELVAAFQRGNAVVDPVRAGAAGVHEAQTAEKNVRLNDILHRRGKQLRLYGLISLNSVPHQDIVTLPGDGHARQGSGVAPADVVRCERALVRHCFVPGDQGVRDSRGEKPRRRPGDDRGIHQYQFGVSVRRGCAEEHALCVIHRSPVRCRGVAGGGGRNDDAWEVRCVRNELDRVEHLAAADPQNDVTVRAFDQVHQHIHILPAALAIEGMERKAAAAAIFDGLHLAPDHVEHAAVYQKEEAVTVLFSVFKNLVQLSGALDIALDASERAGR